MTRVASPGALRWLSVSLFAGSGYDVLFAIINLLVPRWGSRILGIPMPSQEVYLRFTGVFLIVLALFYALPALHPGRYLGNVVVAILGRTAGAVFLCTATLIFDQPRAFLLLGAGDLIFAVLHAVLLARSAGGNFVRHYLD
ncbi:MAG: hypothetical protein ACE5HU_04600 [Acidobacteriota bacterium]